MDRSSRRAGERLRAMALAAVCAGLLVPAAASAQAQNDLTDWNLTETTSTWGGGTNFHISTGGDGTAQFRWLDTPSKTTVISANACPDLALWGSATIGINDTTYKTLFGAPAGTCFVLRGRTAIGSGSMVNHDGRIKR